METAVPILPEWTKPVERRGNHGLNFPCVKTGKSSTECLREKDHPLNRSLENGLFGDIDPQRLKQREQPWERQAQALSMKGWTITEIAEFIGRTQCSVSNALRQPYARERMINEASKSVQDDIKQFLEGEVLPSLEVLRTVRDDPSARNSDRIAASDKLIERFLGKAVQPIVQEQKPVEQMSDEELERAVRANIPGMAQQA
jgi:hypothetical protein